MKTVTFQGTKEQLESITISDMVDVKPQEVETRVYVVKEKEGVYLHSKTNDEFMTLAEEEGRVYTLEGFSQAFNFAGVNSEIDIIRFINQPI
jgi:hypothetical protein